MVIDRDVGDEDDAAESVARMCALIEQTIAAMLKPMQWAPESPRERVYEIRVEPPIDFIQFTCVIVGAPDHDPGDEQPRIW